MEQKRIEVDPLSRRLPVSGFILNSGSTVMCPHGGQVSMITTNTRVMVEGQPAVTVDDQGQVAGCPSGQCVSVEWLVPASRVFVNGKPVILSHSSGICQGADTSPKGTPVVITTQTRVKGT